MAAGLLRRPSEARVVGVDSVSRGVPHSCPAIGEPEGGARTKDESRSIGVEAQEYDSTTARDVDGVKPDVGLEERSQPWDTRSATDPRAHHAEGEQTHVRDTAQGVRPDTRRHAMSDLSRIHGPVQECQILPALVIMRGPDRRGAIVEMGSTPGWLIPSL